MNSCRVCSGRTRSRLITATIPTLIQGVSEEFAGAAYRRFGHSIVSAGIRTEQASRAKCYGAGKN